MRPLVNLLLVALTATGPSVCCSTAATLSRAAFGHLHVRAGIPKNGSPRSCCRHAHNRNPVTAATDNAGRRPSADSPGQPGQPPEDRSCPCQEQRQVPVVSLASGGDARLNPGSRDDQGPGLLLAVFMPPAGALLDRSGLTSPSAPRLPFLSADERLRAHHALRC